MKKITLDEFCHLNFLSAPQFSPNGKRFLFVMSQADKEGNKYTSNLYELPFELKNGKAVFTKEPKQLTSDGKVRSFQYLDDDTILFAGDRDESKEPSLQSKFYRLSLTGGEAAKFLTFPLPAQKVMPLNNGDFVVVASTVPGWEDLYKGDKKRAAEYLKQQKENEDYEVVTQVPWWWNGSTFTKAVYSSLYYMNGKTGAVTMLTPKGLNVGQAKLNKSKTEVWFAGEEVKPKLPTQSDLYCLSLTDAAPKAELVVKSTDTFDLHGFDFGDSFMLLMASDRSHGGNTDPDFYKLSYEDHQVTLYAKYGESIGSSVGSDVRYGGGKSTLMLGDTFYFVSTIFDSSYLFKLEDGKITQLTFKEGSVDAFDAALGAGEQEPRFVTVSLYNTKPQELYDLSGKQLTKVNEKALAGKYVAVPEPLNFNRAGHDVHGFVMKPFGYVPGKQYPVVFDIHGGPKTVYGPVFYHEMQYWASLGYFVIYCNPTGSDGRGEFADIRGKYGTDDYEDLMAFCDACLEAYPDMDKDNLFETGGSYGGFMTNWIIGHTDRFAACASQRSISNWFSFYGVSDIGVHFTLDQCDADPWNDTDKVWWHSPLKYADKVKTPTLFIHSFEDYRCPIDQGYQMYSALIAHGVESKMVLFKGENHELSRSGKPKHRIRRLDEITQWFEVHKR